MAKTTIKNKTKQGNLMPPPDDQFRQQDITGTGTVKQTAPKSVREAIETFFSKKDDLECAKSNADKAKEIVQAEMRATDTKRVVVRDDHGQLYVIEITSKEKLEVSKSK